jgi:predicted phage terminase large subunit-like protein
MLVMTHWHEDDLAGRLIEKYPDEWHIVKIAATAGENDPLGRAPGELLWGDDPAYDYASVISRARSTYEAGGAMRDWYSLYEQDPRPAGGGLFKTDNFVFCGRPEKGTFVRAWDLAATAQFGAGNPDWTVGVLMCRDAAGAFVVCDVVRFRGGPDVVERTILEVAERDGRSVLVSLPQDPGQAGKAQCLYLTRKLAGWTVKSSPETGDKATRAMPFASQVNVGSVGLVKGIWNGAYISELSGFPGVAKDDQVDASSRAFSELVSPSAPARMMYLPHMGR